MGKKRQDIAPAKPKKQKIAPNGTITFTQRGVQGLIVDGFKKTVEALPNNINANFGAGQQVTGALWAWCEILPEELRKPSLLWALGLESYDPASGERIRKKIRQVMLGQGPGQCESPDKPSTDR